MLIAGTLSGDGHNPGVLSPLTSTLSNSSPALIPYSSGGTGDALPSRDLSGARAPRRGRPRDSARACADGAGVRLALTGADPRAEDCHVAWPVRYHFARAGGLWPALPASGRAGGGLRQ